MRNVSDKSCRENQQVYSVTFLLSWIVPFIRSVEKYVTAMEATDGNIIRRMRFACRVTKARIHTQTHTHTHTHTHTYTHSEYVIGYLLLFHGNSCYANAPLCCVIRT
jgi:hypothetical protein